MLKVFRTSLYLPIASIFLSLPLIFWSRSWLRTCCIDGLLKLRLPQHPFWHKQKWREHYCDLCFEFDQFFSQLKRAEEATFRHYPTFKLLHDSAAEGCELCRWLRSVLILNSATYDSLFFSQSQIEILVTLGRTSIPEDPALRAEIEIICGTLSYAQSYAKDIDLDPAWSCGRPTQSMFTQLPIVADADPPAMTLPNVQSSVVRAELDLAQKWLSTCLEEHSNCHSSSSGEFPKRLIYVGINDHTPMLKLVRTSALLQATKGKQGVAYCALSYCWGRTSKKKHLNLDNESRYAQNIREDDLSQTLRDAVYITRSLGYRYLWIDSYCIIQPTPSDSSEWRRESARMCDVYNNAVCTISATGASDSSQGCFIQHEWKRFPVQHCSLSSPNTSYGVREPFIIAPELPSARSISFSPISRRAWTLQERCLSRRVLHWTKDGLFWDCHTDRASSEPLARPEPIGLLAPNYAWEDGFPQVSQEEIANAPMEGWDGVRRRWDEIVSEYSTRSLTEPTDKLIALSGVAGLFQARFEDEYLAGLWRSTLPNGVLWSCHSGTASSVSNDNSYVAPSWSWASGTTNSFVSWFESPIYKLEVLPAVRVHHDRTFTKLAGVDATGAVSHGEMCLTLPFVDVVPDFDRPEKGGSRGGLEYDTLQPPCGAAGGVSYFLDPQFGEQPEDMKTAFISWNNRGFHGLLLSPVAPYVTTDQTRSPRLDSLPQYKRVGAVILDLDLDRDVRSAQNLNEYIDRWETLIII